MGMVAGTNGVKEIYHGTSSIVVSNLQCTHRIASIPIMSTNMDIVPSTAVSLGMAVMQGFADSAQSTRGKYASDTPV